MAKNVIIFSDGTGQAGGVRPDQRLSNIYKLFKATRTGPDSSIDPQQQVAFYDAGLGTDDDARAAPFRLVRFIKKLLGSVTGRGITRNIIECYTFILDNYEPGDRLFLFGFSRGAYTARCVANLLELCGVPKLGPTGIPLARWKPETRQVAEEAVRQVYEHGAGRPAKEFDDERHELARRFREKYQSGDAQSSNAHPYFVGVFDTVASLGARGPMRFLIGAGLVGAVAAVSLVIGSLIGPWFGMSGWSASLVISLASLGWFAFSSIMSTVHIIRDFPNKGDSSWHIAKWKMEHYDQRLPQGITFARHALAIDETRKDFPRVKWGWKGAVDEKIEGQPERFIQLWFAGNHSDIGGSYPEEQSRLSDIALEWMVGEATSIGCPLIVDRTKLNLFPAASGLQHCEVDAMRDAIARWLPRWFPRDRIPTWKEQLRIEVLAAPLHASVTERFNLPKVWKCGSYEAYRPVTLRDDKRFSSLYPSELP